MPEALNLEQIKQAFAGDCDIHLLHSVDSTNEWCLQKARAGAALPLACIAEEQSSGRGRRGKPWLSSPASSITMSLAWQFKLPPRELGALSLVMGIAVAQTLENAGVGNVRLKWPNDVLVKHKKIAGILIETANISENSVVAVIGVGLNYHLPDTLPALPDQPWTDVLSQPGKGREVNRSQLGGHLLRNCMMMCERYMLDRHDWMTEFREKYDIFDQEAVSVTLANGEQLQGLCCGVTAAGEIRIRIAGEERVFNSADISLRNQTTERQLC